MFYNKFYWILKQFRLEDIMVYSMFEKLHANTLWKASISMWVYDAVFCRGHDVSARCWAMSVVVRCEVALAPV